MGFLNLAWDKWGHGLIVAFIVGALGNVIDVLQHPAPGVPLDWHSLSMSSWLTGLAAGYAWLKIQLPNMTIQTTTTTKETTATPTSVVVQEVKEVVTKKKPQEEPKEPPKP